ncbi:HAMP domain-containing histidine kinase [Nakamurella flava]|uniref:histidine kinase n=1 Tax=Nakamurella flava TaxID=2576308 RepID=A0A4U6QM49_9ACTN|nr:HAMP domain-containing sensor histidine kinase [Nakamurella flava]TKV61643.1 HAMP domain-containing histidine kinase [Nakamurella flava]
MASSGPITEPLTAVPVTGTAAARGPLTNGAAPAPRRWTLRARLIALVVGVAAIALVSVDVGLPIALRSVLVTNLDATLNRAMGSLPQTFQFQALQERIRDSSPGSEVGFTLISADGSIQHEPPESEDTWANPDVNAIEAMGVPQTIVDLDDPTIQYRAVARTVTAQSTNLPAELVAWQSTSGVQTAVGRLIVIELLGTAALLLLLGLTSSLIIRRELKPLESIARAADDIADGDLDRRVEEDDPSTEVGRLGVAFNGMLDGISELLDERQRSEQRLRQFAADASHELRTPVAAVRGYTDMYRAGMLSDPAAVQRAMERMGFEAARMNALVQDLLTLIQADAEKTASHERVDLVEVLTGVVEDAAVIDPERQWRWSGWDPAAGRVLVLGDRLRLSQLFANLLGNIRTHTPPGTTATVTVLPGAGEIAVSVSDNGPGVADEDLDRLFDRFYRADPSRSREKGGTGLGLSIVAAIARNHGGRVLAGHSPGGGLTITVVLPRATGTAAVPPPAPAAVPVPVV